MTAVHSGEPTVTVVAGGRRYAVAADAVRRVGFAGPLTALPFVPPWVEGLACVDSEPVLQIDPVRALAGGGAAGQRGTGDKLLVAATSRGTIALRVDRVEPAAGTAPPLPLEALVWGLAAGSGSGGERAPSSRSRPPGDPPATVLVVADGATRTGILIDEGISVSEVATSLRLDTGDSETQLMAAIGDRLIPARRLSDEGGTGRAVIGPTAEGWRAVLVERLIGLEHIPVDRLVRLPGAAAGGNLCFRTADHAAICLRDFARLAGGREAVGAAYRRLLERVDGRPGPAPAQPFPDQAAPGVSSGGNLSGGGLMVSVRGVSWLLPLEFVERMLEADERPAVGRRRPGRDAVPLFDAGLWFPASEHPLPAPGGTRAVLLRLPGGTRIAARVDRVALEAPASAPSWLPPPALPPALAALVDAVRLEPESGLWCLRLASGLDPASLPSSFRRTAAAACLGRLAPADRSRINLQGMPS